ncbi:hypothetical protein F53441_9153 [Fusarium austroafricanum]|uniref:Peroxin/Ferlin domain-containing protein n=1 Tax=Fusarium austroafricanum TaxID=2364996 RepID=A0A8H4K9T8_9HYPO|nr:hypothetical protein F53441_9153 [Fusarium austroafricanum]
MLRVKSSRRPAALKPTDYDHEIALVDHDAAATPTGSVTPEPNNMARYSTTSRLLGLEEEDDEEGHGQNHNRQNGDQQDRPNKKPNDAQTNGHDDSHTEGGTDTRPASNRVENGQNSTPPETRPSIEVQEPTPDAFHGDHPQVKQKKPHVQRETAIDILYENERGGFLCGIPLFSAQALGGFDPPAWNPTWEWAWPEWRINYQKGVDEHGWEYSFYFSKKFSWHSGKWWNSFVRRRAWIRKRVRKRPEDVSADPHMLNTDYFTIRPASHISQKSRASVTSSRLSRSSMGQMSAAEADGKAAEIDNVEDLMRTLRLARIDREKLDAVNNYMEHATDLKNLQYEMHEIMSLFVFQQSRRILLSRLMEIHDETTAQVKKTNTSDLRERNQALKDAVHHADEEVRKLAYWSDVKQMAESGEANEAVNEDKGWDESWEGVDQSGGAHPLRDKATVNSKKTASDTVPLPPRILNSYNATRCESTAAQPEGTNPTESSETGLVTFSNRALEISEREPEQVVANLVTDTHESRNRVFKDAFKIDAPRVAEDKEAMEIFKPVIGKPHQYPNEQATKASLEEHMRDARRQAGLSVVWSHFNKKVPQWLDCFRSMKRTTRRWSERANMSAVRIVLPKTWDIEVNNQNLEYVDSATGVLQKLRAAVDRNPSAIVLRGKGTVLVKVADEIVQHCKEAEIYELGEVAASDYKTRQLWPTIENAPNGGASLPDDHNENIWVHKEYQPHFISVPYEQIPRPSTWTHDNFEHYISTLCYGRVPPHLAIRFYGQRRANGRYIDTDGIRIKLIVGAFDDPTAKPFITAPVLKMAISMMAFRGGHRASANRLVQLGEEQGIPMDTDIYNIMLEGYAHKRDIGFFYGFLQKMKARYHHPNIRTWLLFLRLIRGEDERRQVIVAMYQLGMFNHAATRRGIADVMASLDAYAAFKAGRSLKGFIADQNERYGEGWLAIDGLNDIVVELLRFHRPEDPRIEDCKTLVDIHNQSGHRVELKTINIFLRYAAQARDWDTALWAMTLFKPAGCEPDQETYGALMSLAVRTRSSHALGTVYFYGVLHRKLNMGSRQLLSQVLLRTHNDQFWGKFEHQPGIFPRQAIPELQYHKIPRLWCVMSRVERVILDKWAGYIPLKPLEHSLELSYRSNDIPMHSQILARKPVQVKDLIVKLRRADGQPGNINVRLKGRFDPARMILNWDEARADPDQQGVDQQDEPDSWPDEDDDTTKLLSAKPEPNPKSPGGVGSSTLGATDSALPC